MSTPHRATEEQWGIVEICREEGHTPWPTATCLLELRSRVENLERRCEVQLQQLCELQGRHHRPWESAVRLEGEAINDLEASEASPVATDEELNLIFMQYRDLAAARRAIYDLGRQHGARAAATEADNATAATVAEIRSSLFKDAAPDAPTVKESLTAAPPPLRCPGAHTIAECGGPCEQDFRLCDCGLLQQLNPALATEESSAPAPAGSLVERVAGRLSAACGLQDGQWDEAAIDVIRGVADWFRNQRDSPETAAALEQEADQ